MRDTLADRTSHEHGNVRLCVPVRRHLYVEFSTSRQATPNHGKAGAGGRLLFLSHTMGLHTILLSTGAFNLPCVAAS